MPVGHRGESGHPVSHRRGTRAEWAPRMGLPEQVGHLVLCLAGVPSSGDAH